jgi:hypothetical protein
MKKAMFVTLAQLTLGLIGLFILSFFLHVVAVYTFSGFDYFYMGVEDYNGGWIKSIFVYLLTCLGGAIITGFVLSICFPFIVILFSLVGGVYRANKRKYKS